MKYILICILLLGAGEAWAEDSLPQFSLTGALKIDRASFEALLKDDPDAKLRVMLIDEPCLAQMEAAMRAMEPYTVMPNTFQFIFTGGQDILQINRPPNQRNPLAEAIALWGAAKACWRTP